MFYALDNLFISPKFPRFMTVGDGPWQRARPRLNVWRQTLPSVGTLTGRPTFLDPETLRPLSEGADKRREGLLIGDCFTCRNMPTISAGSENGMVITRCDSDYSVSLCPNWALQNACTKLGQIRLLHWGPMLTRYENRFVAGCRFFWTVNQVHICRFSPWFRRCYDYGIRRIARFWRERYDTLSHNFWSNK